MAKLLTTLAALLAFSCLAFAAQDSEIPTSLRIISGGKTVATLKVPKGKMTVQGNNLAMRADLRGRTMTYSGKVSITVTCDGEQVLQITADEVIVDLPAAPIQTTN